MELGSPGANFSESVHTACAEGTEWTQPIHNDKEVSVLLSDISGYNALTEGMEASEVGHLLNEYFGLMAKAVYQYKQTLEQQIASACIGNRLIAAFGSPQPLSDHAWIALQTALEMCRRLDEYNHSRLVAKKPAIRIGIGIHSDQISGNQIGQTNGLDFMAIGAGVYIGYRLEGICKQYGCQIVISENTYRQCADRIWVRELDLIRLRGNNYPLAIYEFLGLKSDPISEQKQQVINHYYKGREYYLNRKFAIAMGEFASVMEIDSNDKAAAIQLKRCQHWLKSPPPENEVWDGAWSLS